jgi:tetratricopeptide (TPR) repeat protein
MRNLRLVAGLGLLSAGVVWAQTSGNFANLSTRAGAARDANRLQEAVTLYRKALTLRPTWKDGWWSLGTILYDSDEYRPAAQAFRKLIVIDPKNGTANLMLGLCEYHLADYAASMKHIESAKRLGIKKDEQLEHVLLYHEGMLRLRAGQYDDAMESFSALVKQGVRSEELDVAVGMAVLLISPKAANASPERIVAIAAGRAEQLNLLNNFDGANAAYSALASQDPTFPNVHYAFGRFLLSRGEADKALVQFQEEIQRDPKHIRARMELAASYYRTDSAAGIPYALEVVKQRPSYPFGHYLLGLLYFDSGDVPRSVPELEIAARMVPKEAQFQFALGNAYAKVGRKADAARARAAFRQLGGDAQSSAGSDTYGNQPSLKIDAASAPVESR